MKSNQAEQRSPPAHSRIASNIENRLKMFAEEKIRAEPDGIFVRHSTHLAYACQPQRAPDRQEDRKVMVSAQNLVPLEYSWRFHDCYLS